ncbi:large subunit ribosomal protein L12e [Senna tora]|uniref:Large subunit ribosomal protein L12e n=1 Tax=Senna tora TaxID=362788 RepID=A0A834TCW5_9FABA|nr:large subunit ribosomal protein L12e [Senna tora]
MVSNAGELEGLVGKMMGAGATSIHDFRSLGSFPSTVHPTETQVPRISLTVPLKSLPMDLCRMILAISMTSSRVMFPLCFYVLCLLAVSFGLLQGLNNQCSSGWHHRSFAVSFAMSSPIFFRERPSGPIFGASEIAAPTPPPRHSNVDVDNPSRIELWRHFDGEVDFEGRSKIVMEAGGRTPGPNVRKIAFERQLCHWERFLRSETIGSMLPSSSLQLTQHNLIQY